MKAKPTSVFKRIVSAVTAVLISVMILPSSAFALEEEKTVDLYFEPTSLQPAYNNAIFINGEFYSYIGESGAQTIKIPQSKFENGENTVTFICGSSATGTYYDETVAPNTRNHNDPKVKNLKITTGGKEYTPSSVTGHYITDASIPAAKSSRTESKAYAANTDYVFGDGQPGGTPHPASLTIPYKIDFKFNISLTNETAHYETNLEENAVYSGIINVAATASTENEDLQMYVDDKEVKGKGSGKVSFRYSSNGIQANDGNHFQNGFYINASLADILNEDEPVIGIEQSNILFGQQNVISLTIGNGTAPYDDTVEPGAVNHDDFSVSNFDLILPDGSVLTPSRIVTYRAVDQQTPASENNIVSQEEYTPGKSYQMGDGFPAGSDLNMFYKIDLIYDVPENNSLIHFYTVDTTEFGDGSHAVSLRSGGELKKNTTIRFDNTAPVITPNFENGAVLANGTSINVTMTDAVSGVDTAKTAVTLNGTAVKLPYKLSTDKLQAGSQLLTVHAVDIQGNISDQAYTFSLKDSGPAFSEVGSTPNGDQIDFSVQTDSFSSGKIKVDFYAASPLDVFYSSGVSEETTLGNDVLGASEKTAPSIVNEISSSEGLPYQLYEVDVKGKSGTVQLSCNASTLAGETLTFQVYNYTSGQWEILDRGKSSGAELHFSAQVETGTYAKDNKIQVAIAPYLVDNGSDTFAWISDTQYYTQRPELIDSKIYEKMLNWSVGQYQSGNIGYVAHTGDIVETSSSEQQFILASGVQGILDRAGVPNGIVSGNHDVGADIGNLKYSLYQKYFGASRYENFDWYGGDYDDNTHHYDLVTIGGQDMIFLYLGMGKEALAETVAWANDVLETYSHRTAVIALHEYLNPQSDFITYARGEEIFNQIIVPNDNVAMVLCGHDPGASRNIRTVPGTDRKVVEILSDYQNATNGGNGFLRLMRFADGKLENKTYSPVTDQYNCFDASIDEFSVEMPMVENERVVITKDFSAGLLSEETVPFATVTVDAGQTAIASLPIKDVDFDGWFAVLTDENGNQVQTPVTKLSVDSQGGNESNENSGNPDDNHSNQSGGNESNENSGNPDDNHLNQPGGNANDQSPATPNVPEKPNDTPPKTGDSSFTSILVAAILLLLTGTGLTRAFIEQFKKKQ